MQTFVYRNHTVEHLFDNFATHFSGFGSVEEADPKYSKIIWYHKLTPYASIGQIIDEINEIAAKIKIVFSGGCNQRQSLIILPSLIGCLKLQVFNDTLDVELLKLCSVAKTIANQHKNIIVIKEDSFIGITGNCFNPKYYYTSGILIEPKFISPFRDWISGVFKSIEQQRKKCFILDCDNTLWGGIVGEDGVNGVALFEGYPGNAYRDFQRLILQIKDFGIILALCSKNNAVDVWEMFEKNPGMILKRNDISCSRINWENKSKNIVEIAKELNIGLDSIVFVDDSKFEREQVKIELPSVVVPDFPEHVYDLPAFGDSIYKKYFRISGISEDDKVRTQYYIENQSRNKFKSEFKNIEEYLIGLKMEVSLSINQRDKYIRIAQMTQKTNQFNLTTKRYSEADIDDLAKSGALVTCLSVVDRFGDNGVVAVAIIKKKDLTAIIDVFLMSCRVIGRDIERCFFNLIYNHVSKNGFTKMVGEYIPTQKNGQAKDFYMSVGFSRQSEGSGGLLKFELDVEGEREIGKKFAVLKNI
jgi:FkbH-like protein